MSPVAALPGNVRLRAFQLGKETTFGTPVNATRRFGWSFAPVIDPHWTWPVEDTGTLDYALNPYRMRIDVTGTATGPLAFDDAPYLWAALTKAGVTPTSHVWDYLPASKSQDAFEIFTGEWGDETPDQYQMTSGVLDKLTLTYPEDLGPIQVSADWRFAAENYPHAMQALDVDFAPVWAYMADTSLYINDSSGTIGTTKLTNAMHGATVEIANNLDVKSFANGSNSRFQVAGYGRGLRTFAATFTFAKASAALAEIQDWLAPNPVERFVSLKTVSPVLIPTTAIQYAHEIKFPGYYFTNTAGIYQTANTTNQLRIEGFFDDVWGQAFEALVTTKLAAL
jgi:hypothetical protein